MSKLVVGCLLLLLQAAVTVQAFSQPPHPSGSSFTRTRSSSGSIRSMRMTQADPHVSSSTLSPPRRSTSAPTLSSRAVFLQRAALTLGGGLSLLGTAGQALAVPASEGPDLNPILLQMEGKTIRFGDAKGKKATIVVNVVCD